MNIEIANRMVQLRKKKGLSQEELAEKLGISRQAVSKWERAESSPDTDNLILLARLYQISLDDLLKTDDPVENRDPEGIVGEKEEKISLELPKVPGQEETSAAESSQKEEQPTLEIPSQESVKEAAERLQKQAEQMKNMAANPYGENAEQSQPQQPAEKSEPDFSQESVVYSDPIPEEPHRHSISNQMIGMCVVALLICIVLWIFLNIKWFLVLGCIVLCPIIARTCHLEGVYPVLITILYLVLGFLFDLWHPGWMLYLTIPIFYAWVGNQKKKN
ncbi:helix-turn-helix domain-containing protein [Caproicibacterium sp. BJN0003]|uniref:helix-turn-helix domain-containing protein n=1 Tax=Caproicibacterium sp. BJN0003 TaxID=2994078 RepID=UPI00225A0F94|nr:helix-turn-helix domain-containing protein [Caproicibacterium sp. BJN0003]UZT82484.1 helix-turn-helix domain-containing protein [Caproicibacterium sp. BJN0003]